MIIRNNVHHAGFTLTIDFIMILVCLLMSRQVSHHFKYLRIYAQKKNLIK